MSYFDALILGLVQGLTEFLPISSSGHLVIAQTLLGVLAPGIFLEIAVHVATLLSVVLVYWRRLLQLATGAVRGDRAALEYIGLLALASVPAAFFGLTFQHRIEAAFDAPAVTGFMLLITGGILWSTRWRSGPETERPTVMQAVGMGFAQALALLPGISRSGSTIAAGLWLRLRGDQAAEFSFLMSVPAVGGAALLQALELEGAVPVTGPLVLAFVTALVSGIAAIGALIWLIRRQAFHRFAWYLWPAGLIFLAYLYAT